MPCTPCVSGTWDPGWGSPEEALGTPWCSKDTRDKSFRSHLVGVTVARGAVVGSVCQAVVHGKPCTFSLKPYTFSFTAFLSAQLSWLPGSVRFVWFFHLSDCR